jgi:hypothetical protein
MPSLCGEAAGLAEALVRGVAEAAEAAAEAWLDAAGPGAAAALARADVAQLLRTDPLYPPLAGPAGPAGLGPAAVGPEEMEAFFAVAAPALPASRSPQPALACRTRHAHAAHAGCCFVSRFFFIPPTHPLLTHRLIPMAPPSRPLTLTPLHAHLHTAMPGPAHLGM